MGAGSCGSSGGWGGRGQYDVQSGRDAIAPVRRAAAIRRTQYSHSWPILTYAVVRHIFHSTVSSLDLGLTRGNIRAVAHRQAASLMRAGGRRRIAFGFFYARRHRAIVGLVASWRRFVLILLRDRKRR
jgi:hypothetical protein